MSSRSRGLLKSLHSADQRAFCALMRETRLKAGLTQHDLARRLKRPQSFVAKYEGGERRLDVVEFLVVLRAMDVDPGRVLRALLKRMV
jgi:transcriptional regulator with XRE-family HTH domain